MLREMIKLLVSIATKKEKMLAISHLISDYIKTNTTLDSASASITCNEKDNEADPKHDIYIVTSNIGPSILRDNDILFGRVFGNACIGRKHYGTKKYRKIIKENKESYCLGMSNKKSYIIQSILDKLQQENVGRYLCNITDTAITSKYPDFRYGVYELITDEKVLKDKISHALRVNQPKIRQEIFERNKQRIQAEKKMQVKVEGFRRSSITETKLLIQPDSAQENVARKEFKTSSNKVASTVSNQTVLSKGNYESKSSSISITEINEMDVLFGINGSSCAGLTHKGNIEYNAIVKLHQWQYCIAKPKERSLIARYILSFYRLHNNRRLLQKQKGSKEEFLEIVNDTMALKKLKASLSNGSIERRKQFVKILAESNQSNIPGTIRIEIPCSIILEILQSPFIIKSKTFDEDYNFKNSDDCVKYLFFATIEVPCSYNAKAQLTVESNIKQMQSPTPDCDSKKQQQSCRLSMDCDNITLDTSQISAQGVGTINRCSLFEEDTCVDYISFELVSTLLSMKSFSSVAMCDKILENNRSARFPLTLEFQTINPDDDEAQIQEMLKIMSEDVNFTTPAIPEKEDSVDKNVYADTLSNELKCNSFYSIQTEMDYIQGSIHTLSLKYHVENESIFSLDSFTKISMNDTVPKSNPLLYAIIKHQRDSIVLKLIDMFPKCVYQFDPINNQYPLHYALLCDQTESVVMKLINKFPAAVYRQDIANGCYPLHYACDYIQSETVVLKMIKLYPGALQGKDKTNEAYPLHYACAKRQTETVVLKMIELYPCAVQHKDSTNDWYPLHYACAYNQSEAVVLAMIHKYPTAIQHTDKANDWYPLHFACAKNQSETVVLMMIERYPAAVKHKGKTNEWYPLHFACANNQSETVVLKMIAEYPDAVKHRGRTNDWYPLHYACAKNQSEQVVLKLIQIYPSAVEHRGKTNDLYPLHISCAMNQSETVVLKLLEVFPKAAAHRNGVTGLYPLHVACAKYHTESVLLQLIEAYPEAAKCKDKYTGLYPFHIASARNQSTNVLSELIRIYPEAVPYEVFSNNADARSYVRSSHRIVFRQTDLLDTFPDAVKYSEVTPKLDIMREDGVNMKSETDVLQFGAMFLDTHEVNPKYWQDANNSASKTLEDAKFEGKHVNIFRGVSDQGKCNPK